jgi:hypothetical protein
MDLRGARLEILVAGRCEASERARATARRIRGTYPGVRVEVIELDWAAPALREKVFATPTYLLDGRIVALGNPSPDEIGRWLA